MVDEVSTQTLDQIMVLRLAQRLVEGMYVHDQRSFTNITAVVDIVVSYVVVVIDVVVVLR